MLEQARGGCRHPSWRDGVDDFLTVDEEGPPRCLGSGTILRDRGLAAELDAPGATMAVRERYVVTAALGASSPLERGG